ncbi:MAG: PDZ domain-containing protein [Planctomycetota bacterium]|jgi:hypothetical protein
MRTLAVLIVAAGIATAQEKAKEAAPGFLGVHVGQLHAETRALFPKIPKDLAAGAVLTEIVKGSPAEAAGLRKGDVVIWFDGKEIGNHEDLFAAVQAKRAGDKVAYRLRRGTGKIEGWLTLAKRPEPAIEIVPIPVPVPEPRRPAPAPKKGLEDRLDRLDKDVEELRERLLKARARAAPLHHPRSVGGWAHREEQLAKAAHKRGDMDKYRYHAVRLSVLKEMLEAGAKLPARRLDRIEKKLDRILEHIERNR